MSQPAHKIRDGVLQAVIWRNTSERGTYYTVNIARSYRQGESWGPGESWGQT